MDRHSEIRVRLLNITQGWHLVNYQIHDRETKFNETGSRIGETPNLLITIEKYLNGYSNAQFIVNAPADIEFLLAECERLWSELALTTEIKDGYNQLFPKYNELLAENKRLESIIGKLMMRSGIKQTLDEYCDAKYTELQKQIEQMRNCWNCIRRHGRHKECYPCDDFENWVWEANK